MNKKLTSKLEKLTSGRYEGKRYNLYTDHKNTGYFYIMRETALLLFNDESGYVRDVEITPDVLKSIDLRKWSNQESDD